MVVGDDERTVERQGDGPVDAAFACVNAVFEHDATLQLYQVHAVTEGIDGAARECRYGVVDVQRTSRPTA